MSVPVKNNKRKEWREEGEKGEREKKQCDFDSISCVRLGKLKFR